MMSNVSPQKKRCRWASRRAINFTMMAVAVAVASARGKATEYFVSSAAQIATAMQTAQPGDILTMTDGTWTNQRIAFAGNGTSGAPITLRAQTPAIWPLGGRLIGRLVTGSITSIQG